LGKPNNSGYTVVACNFQKMNKVKLKKISEGFDLITGLIFTGFAFYLTIMVILSDSTNKLIGYLFLVIWYIISYLCLSTALYRLRYRMVSKGLEVIVDRKNKTLNLLNHLNGTHQTIDKSIIKEIEVYYSWNTTPFSSDLGYSKITLEDNSKVFLTSTVLSQSTVESLFKAKVSKVKTRFMNKLS